MGVVYKGFQHSLSRLVAIKVLPPEFQSDPERVERFHREAQAIAILSHPNIVQIIDKGAEGKTLYFVMEFVDGVSLDTLLRERRLTLVESLHVAKEIAKGLAGAHASGIIHRDLKPRNVLVSRDLSMVKLVDFGISRVEVLSQAAGPLTSAHTSLGTLYYYSPEQARDPSKVDQRSDIYSLGVICYEMLTGQVPVGQFQLPSEVNPELSSQVDALLLKCLATDRAKRYAGAKDFLADVDKLEKAAGIALLDELKTVSKTTSRIAQHATSRRARNALIAAGVAAAALVGGYLAWSYLGNRAQQPPAASAAPAPAETPAALPPDPATDTSTAGPGGIDTDAKEGSSTPAESAAAAPAPVEQPALPPPASSKAAPSAPAGTGSPPSAPASAARPTPAPSTPAGRAGSPTPPSAPSTTAALEIDEARQLVAARRYDEASAALAAFLAKYPKDSYALEAAMMTADLQDEAGPARRCGACLSSGRRHLPIRPSRGGLALSRGAADAAIPRTGARSKKDAGRADLALPNRALDGRSAHPEGVGRGAAQPARAGSGAGRDRAGLPDDLPHARRELPVACGLPAGIRQAGRHVRRCEAIRSRGARVRGPGDKFSDQSIRCLVQGRRTLRTPCERSGSRPPRLSAGASRAPRTSAKLSVASAG